MWLTARLEYCRSLWRLNTCQIVSGSTPRGFQKWTANTSEFRRGVVVEHDLDGGVGQDAPCFVFHIRRGWWPMARGAGHNRSPHFFSVTLRFQRSHARRWIWSSTLFAFSPSSASRNVMGPPSAIAWLWNRAFTSV